MDEISKLRIKGGFYESQVDINLRTSNNHRVTTIYGSNGSGKSSIANAILEYKRNENVEVKEFENIVFLSNDSKEISLSVENKNNIWIYSEKYIDENIIWDNDNLGAIVMFGEQIEIDSIIKSKTNELSDKKEELKKIETEKYESDKGDFSIDVASEKIRSLLRKNWAEREKKIRNLKTAPVNESVINQIYAIQNANVTTYNKLKSEYDEKLTNFLKISKNQEKLSDFRLEIIGLDNFEQIKTVLKQKISRPKGTIIEKKLLNLILEGKKKSSYRFI